MSKVFNFIFLIIFNINITFIFSLINNSGIITIKFRTYYPYIKNKEFDLSAEDYYNKNVQAGKKFCLTCYGMSAWLYYQFNNKAKIPCRIIGNSEHHVVELYKNNQWYKPTDEYSKYCIPMYHRGNMYYGK